jgi:hypothetical protein
MHEAHGIPIAGHLGRAKTLERLARQYFWPKISADVHHYKSTCLTFQKTKTGTSKPIRLLHPLPPPSQKVGAGNSGSDHAIATNQMHKL